MSYIEREPFQKKLESYRQDCLLESDNETAQVFDDVIAELQEAPDADVTGVVRCKDCIYSFMSITGKTVLYCDMHPSDDHLNLDKDYYCADGKRRTDNE